MQAEPPQLFVSDGDHPLRSFWSYRPQIDDANHKQVFGKKRGPRGVAFLSMPLTSEKETSNNVVKTSVPQEVAWPKYYNDQFDEVACYRQMLIVNPGSSPKSKTLSWLR